MIKHHGFTLVELLVAIAIFAILAAMGWKVFEHISHVKERNVIREQHLADLQQAYQILLKDSVQMIPVTANVNGDSQPALMLQDGRLMFSKSGVIDPLEQGKPAFERIEYIYKESDKTLLRLRYQNLNYNGNEPPQSGVLLTDIENFKMTVLNPDELDIWPIDVDNSVNKKNLAKGIKMNFTYHGTDYEWIFSLMNTSYQSGDSATK